MRNKKIILVSILLMTTLFVHPGKNKQTGEKQVVLAGENGNYNDPFPELILMKSFFY